MRVSGRITGAVVRPIEQAQARWGSAALDAAVTNVLWVALVEAISHPLDGRIHPTTRGE